MDQAQGEVDGAATDTAVGGAMRHRWRRGDVVAVAALVVLIVLVWLPRLRGPIDLRWDAAVYYVTGTAIYEGKGYRLISEPGEVLAVQYPPLLPAVAAAVQWAAGTNDYVVAGWWLRLLYAGIYALYVLAIYALARRYFGPLVSFAATVMAALSFNTVFMSDLLFTEIPFALCIVGVILLNRRSERAGGFAAQTAIAWAAFLLRSAGIALLAAWVLDAALRRRWKQTAARAVLAAAPVLGWQGYVGHVAHSPEYVRPAYEYQRASYQYYNVPYAENLKLIDPFAPELGRTTAAHLARRVVGSGPALVRAAGNSIMSSPSILRTVVTRTMAKAGLKPRTRTVMYATRAGGYVFGLSAIVGIVVLMRRREWLIPLTILGIAGLMAVTPWPEQFGRYFSPTIPLLVIATLVAFRWLGDRLTDAWRKRRARMGQFPAGAVTSRRAPGSVLFAFVVVGLTLAHVVVMVDVYRGHVAKLLTGGINALPDEANSLLFYSSTDWQMYELAVDWLREHASPGSMVVSDAPQWVYMKSGLKGVMTPMVDDAAEAARLIADVPVSYAIDNEVDIGEITTRYLRPALARAKDEWHTVYVTPDGKTRVLRRTDRAGMQGE